MKPIRLTVFPEWPEALLVLLPEDEDEEILLPPLSAPLNREALLEACRDHEVEARVTEGTPGRWTQSLGKMAREGRAERRQRTQQTEAAVLLGYAASDDQVLRDRAALVGEKKTIDEELRECKARLGKAKSDAFASGRYMDPHKYRKLEQRIVTLKNESLALQERLGALREARRNGSDDSFPQRFIDAARQMLEPEVFALILQAVKDTTPAQPRRGSL